MADFTLPRPRRNFGGSLNIPGYARALPNAYGTDTYQAGIPQDRESTLQRAGVPTAPPAPIGAAGASPGMPSDQANNALRADQTAALAAHAQYRQQLNTLGDANQARQNDLKLAENLLIATDPTMDKAVRKFMLSGLSSAVGVDPKGEYSKNIQAMVMQLQPENLEAMRRAFVPDIQSAAPGAISKGLEGLFNGSIPVENVMKQIKIDQQNRIAAGAAATAPSPEQMAASEAGAAAASAVPPAAPQQAGTAPAPALPPGQGVTAQVGRAAPGTGGLAGLQQVTQPAPTEQVAQLSRPSIDQPGAMVGGGTIEVTPGAPDEGGGGPPVEPVNPQAPRPQGAPPVSTPPAEAGGFDPSMVAAAEAAGAGITAPGPEIGATDEPLPPVPSTPPPEVAARYGAPGTEQAAGGAGAAAGPAPEGGPSNIDIARDLLNKLPPDVVTGKKVGDALFPPEEQAVVPAAPTTTGATAPPAGPTGAPPPTGPGKLRQTAEGVGGAVGAVGRTVLDTLSPSDTGRAEPDVAKAATQMQESGAPIVDPTTGQEMAPAGPSGRQGIQDQVAEINARPPDLKTPNLRYVKPEDRDENERPIPGQFNSLPGINPQDRLSFRDAKKLYPEISGEKEYVKRFEDQSKNTASSVYATARSSLETAKLIQIARDGGQLGGIDLNINTPWGKLDAGQVSPGTMNSWLDRVGQWFKSETKVSDDQFSSLRESADQFAAKQMAGLQLNRSDKATLNALLQAKFLENAFEIARANNNGGKQITDKDLQFGMSQGGSITLTPEQNMALLKNNTDNSIRNAGRALGDLVGNPNVGANWDKLSSAERQDLMKKHIELGKDSPIKPETFKEIYAAESDYQTLRKGGQLQGDRFIKPTGDTEADWRRAQQAELTTEEGRKISAEARHEQTSQLEMEKWRALQEERVQNRLDKLRHEAQQQQQRMAQAFQHIGAMLARGHMPAVGATPALGGGEDASAFRMTPAPQRRPPPIPQIQIPQRMRLK